MAAVLSEVRCVATNLRQSMHPHSTPMTSVLSLTRVSSRGHPHLCTGQADPWGMHDSTASNTIRRKPIQHPPLAERTSIATDELAVCL